MAMENIRKFSETSLSNVRSSLSDLRENVKQMKIPEKPEFLRFMSDEAYRRMIYGIGAAAGLGGVYYIMRKLTAERCQHVLVISGPPGVGKTSLIERLRMFYPDLFFYVTAYTTGNASASENEGRTIHFVGEGEMKSAIAAGEFAEWSEHGEFINGTKTNDIKAIVLGAKKIAVVDVDPESVRMFKKAGISATYISIIPPSVDDLFERLKGSTDEGALKRRATYTEKLVDLGKDESMFDAVIVNDDFELAYAQLEEACLPLIEHHFNHY